MPKKDKARKKKTGQEGSRSILYKAEGQEYATAGKMLGNGRFKAQCQDGTERMCIIRGAMRNRTWIAEGDLVLLGLRPFEDDKADVIHKYHPDEARRLAKDGAISNLKVKEQRENIEEAEIDFEEDEENLQIATQQSKEIDFDDL